MFFIDKQSHKEYEMSSWDVMFRQHERWMWKLAFQGEYNIHLYGKVLVKNLIISEHGYISMFWMFKSNENNLVEQNRLEEMCGFHYAQPLLG